MEETAKNHEMQEIWPSKLEGAERLTPRRSPRRTMGLPTEHCSPVKAIAELLISGILRRQMSLTTFVVMYSNRKLTK